MQFQLKEVDAVTITLVVDNCIDLTLAGSGAVGRFIPGRPAAEAQPLAEHGFSALIQARQGTRAGTVLFDAGASRQGLDNNLKALAVDPREIEAIILSHGHADHAAGLAALPEWLPTRELPLLAHPDAFLERRVVLPDGTAIPAPPPQPPAWLGKNFQLLEEPGASGLLGGMLLVSGEVPRSVDPRATFPGHQAHRCGRWEPDPLIRDDQCAILHLRGKGLVIVTGCSHAGLLNIVHHAQQLTGVETIHALIGGFHLSGAAGVERLPETLACLEQLRPRYLLPCHCTGWQASHAMARLLPDAFIFASVGTTLSLER